MTSTNPKQTVDMLDEAFNAADLERVLSFYEEEAVLVVEPGRLARGKGELRRAFEPNRRDGWVGLKPTARLHASRGRHGKGPNKDQSKPLLWSERD